MESAPGHTAAAPSAAASAQTNAVRRRAVKSGHAEPALTRQAASDATEGLSRPLLRTTVDRPGKCCRQRPARPGLAAEPMDNAFTISSADACYASAWTRRDSRHHFGLCGGGHALLPGGSGFRRGLVVESEVQSPVVVVGCPVLDVAAGAGAVGPGGDADLCFDGGEERRGRGAVEARAGPAGAPPSSRRPRGWRACGARWRIRSTLCYSRLAQDLVLDTQASDGRCQAAMIAKAYGMSKDSAGPIRASRKVLPNRGPKSTTDSTNRVHERAATSKGARWC